MNYPVKIFVIYAREDKVFKEGLITALSPLKNQGWVESWHDGNIQAGQVWGEQIRHHLNDADLIIPLISSDFFASEYIQQVEILHAFERFDRGECSIVPVIARACEWDADRRLSRLQVLPQDGMPIGSWDNQDEAYKSVVAEIRKLVLKRKAGDAVAFLPKNENEEQPLRPFWKQYRLPLLGVIAVIAVFFVFQTVFQEKEQSSLPKTFIQDDAAEISFLDLKSDPSIPKIDTFLVKFPNSGHVAEAKQMLDGLKKDFDFYLQSAEALYRANEKDKAFEEFSKARDINPEAPEIKQLLQKLK